MWLKQKSSEELLLMSVPLVFYHSYNSKQARSSILLPGTGFYGIVLAASNWILQIWSFLSA